MTNPVLYCDIDSTINDHWIRIHRNSRGGVIMPSAFSEFEVMKDRPLPYAKEVLGQFAGAGWDVNFLSSRNWNDALRITNNWVMAHNFKYKTVHLVESHDAKLDVLRSVHCDLYIDDFSIGQETGNAWIKNPVLLRNVIDNLPCSFEVFQPFGPNNWEAIRDKYFFKLGNGEYFWEFMRRNLGWWRGNREMQSQCRNRDYVNFVNALKIPLDMIDKIVAEIGAGPFGGLIDVLDMRVKEKVFIDPIMHGLKTLNFIEWDSSSRFVNDPAENIGLPDKSVDVLLSYNALDHGWDILKALDEIIRVSKEFYVAFDCKGNRPLQQDQFEHFQLVVSHAVQDHLDKRLKEGRIKEMVTGDLRVHTPYNFDHNWDFPVFYCHALCT